MGIALGPSSASLDSCNSASLAHLFYIQSLLHGISLPSLYIPETLCSVDFVTQALVGFVLVDLSGIELAVPGNAFVVRRCLVKLFEADPSQISFLLELLGIVGSSIPEIEVFGTEMMMDVFVEFLHVSAIEMMNQGTVVLPPHAPFIFAEEVLISPFTLVS
ncbi:uncharacterized protein DS421_15g509510 [Arachis hypogaea]|nr:uncharacterized protein DS421_15g509510 [Arachis hypogaea]